MSVLEKLKKQIDSHEVISFDIFDTLLVRPYVKPTDLFLHMEKIYNASGFAENRIKSEQEARKKHSDKEDITLDEIYDEVLVKYKDFKQKEMDFEAQVLQPNPQMKEVFDYAKKQNKKIIIISDMYLPQDFLEKVLKEKGFAGFEKLYVSCAIKKTKWTGTLYDYVLSDLNAIGYEILHIGDNKQSDFELAKKKGLNSFLESKPIDLLIQQNERAQKLYQIKKDNLDASILLGIMAIYELNKNQEYWEDFAFKYAGPVIYGYVSWLKKEFATDKIREVLFVARDGYSLQKVFNIINDTGIKSHYYYAPRILNLVCNLNYRHSIDQGEKFGLVALNSVLNYFKTKDEFLEKNTPTIKTCAEGDAFIKKHIDIYQRLAIQEQKNYQKYFEQFNITGKKVALVDTCSTFLSAQKSLMVGLPDKDIKGYYWFTWEGTQKDISKYNTSTFQQTHRQEFLDWSIMEFFMTAPTPPAERIEDGKVILKKINSYEKKRMEVYPFVCNGIVKYTEFVKKIFNKYTVSFDDTLLIEWVNILIAISTTRDMEMLSNIQHAGDAEHTIYQPILLSWFNKNNANYYSLNKNKKFWLFGIPFLKLKKTTHSWNFLLFHCLSFVKFRIKTNRKTFYFFNLPLFQIRNKKNKTKFLLFKTLPIITVKRK